MQLLDNEFFEEYKHLDKLCSEIYSCRNGISEYISQMENESYEGQYCVSSWKSDYKNLKHVRWVRNQIAHNPDAYRISNPEDLTFVKAYYNRILKGHDSLALLKNHHKKSYKGRIPSNAVKKKNAGKRLLLIGIYFGIIILIFIFLSMYN